MTRGRADIVLVQRGFFESRARAQAAIAAGLVKVDGMAIRKPSETIADAAAIEAEAPHPYVSRGGVKLAHALDVFSIDPSALRSLDVGSSTGGFTDVLLARGAAHVTAVDTGRGQMHPRLRAHPRLSLHEESDIRKIDAALLGAPFDLITVDVSFISLGLIIPALEKFAAPRCVLIALIKPQFEAGKKALNRKGIVSDPAAQIAVRDAVLAMVEKAGWRVRAHCDSPIAGGDGNREFLMHADRF